MTFIKKLFSEDGLPVFFVIFYVVGLGLYFIPDTRQLFIYITPYTLVLVALAAFWYHPEWGIRSIAVFTIIFAAGLFVEILGVATGKIFGVYQYGSGLGWKIAGVPVVIGLNWLVLTYGSNALLAKITRNKILKIIGASGLMVVYDMVLEKAAPMLAMWEFDSLAPPLKNYIMWFLLAALFQLLIELFKIKTNNKPARALFLSQLVFFTIIVIFG